MIVISDCLHGYNLPSNQSFFPVHVTSYIHVNQLQTVDSINLKFCQLKKIVSAGEGGGLAVMSSQNISNLLLGTIHVFIFIQLQQRPFILRYSLFESDGRRIIYLFS